MNTFERASQILSASVGEQKAVTINSLAALLGISRRETESLLETKIDAFPFPLVSGASGYYIPTDADDLNHYLASLHSRASKIFKRFARVRDHAIALGYRRSGKRLANPAGPQMELPLQ